MDLGSFAEKFAGLAFVALRSFLQTFLVGLLLGAGLAALSYYVLREHPLAATLSAVLALAEAVFLGIVIGGKRALVLSLAHGLRTAKLGSSVVHRLFEHMGTAAPSTGQGHQGTLARLFERLPLAQAEARLSNAIAEFSQADTLGPFGWFRRLLRERLFALIRALTLAHFREAGARESGVNLSTLRTALAEKADDALYDRLTKGLYLWNFLLAFGLPALVLGQTFLILLLLRQQ